jgi:hypothetical protein
MSKHPVCSVCCLDVKWWWSSPLWNDLFSGCSCLITLTGMSAATASGGSHPPSTLAQTGLLCRPCQDDIYKGHQYPRNDSPVVHQCLNHFSSSEVRSSASICFHQQLQRRVQFNQQRTPHLSCVSDAGGGDHMAARQASRHD